MRDLARRAAGRRARSRQARGCRRRRGRGRPRRRATASVRLSDSSSQVIRRQLAPSAAWIASSCCRPSARTRNRLATLAHAISRTRPTVPSRIQSIWPTSPITSADSGRTLRPDLRVVEHLPRESGRQRKALDRERQHPRDVGVGLFDRDARLQPRDPLVAEVADDDLGAVEAERHRRICGLRSRKRKLSGSTPMIS